MFQLSGQLATELKKNLLQNILITQKIDSISTQISAEIEEEDRFGQNTNNYHSVNYKCEETENI